MLHIGQCLQRHYCIVGKNSRMKSQHRSLHQWRRPASIIHPSCPVSLLPRTLHQWRQAASIIHPSCPVTLLPRTLHQWSQPASIIHPSCTVSLRPRTLHQWRQPASISHPSCPVSLLPRTLHQSFRRQPASIIHLSCPVTLLPRTLHQWRQPASCPVSLLPRTLHQWRQPASISHPSYPVALLPSYHRRLLPLLAGCISVPVTWTGKSASHRGLASDSGLPRHKEINPWWQNQIEMDADEDGVQEVEEVEHSEVEMNDAVKVGKDSHDENSGRIVTVARLNGKEEQVIVGVKPKGKDKVDIKWTPDSGVRLSMLADAIKFKPNSTNEVLPVLGKLDVTERNRKGADHQTAEGKSMDEDGVEEVAICPHCGVGFSNESALQEHIDKTDTQKVGGCDVLRKTKNEKEILAGKKRHVCEICELGFDKIRDLRQHRLIHNSSNDFKCEECGKTYKHEASLKRHLKYYHSSDLKFACPECKKTFRMNCDMIRHMRTVCIPEVKNHKCGQCNKKFADNNALVDHIKSYHNPEHKFKCDKCEYTFATNRKLSNHIKAIHEYDRPHQCEDCGATFKSTRDLNHHRIRMHTFDWPHKCEVCGEQGIEKGFMFPNELKKHMMADHPAEYQDQLETEMPAVCDKCNKRFSTVQQLNNHYRKVHRLLI